MNNNSVLLKLIKDQVSLIFENDSNLFHGMDVIVDIQKDDSVWEPLYKFLEHFFHEKKIKAADGFMFYGGYKANLLSDKPTFYVYKHGITRKSIILDQNGDPCEWEYKMTNNKFDPHLVVGYKTISFEKAFKNIYKDIIKSIEVACKENDCKIPDDSYLMSYTDYRVLRDLMLTKHGYKVSTIKNKGDVEKFSEDNLEEEWSKKYKKNIDCSNPKGFSQKAHCAARKKRQRGEKTKSKSPFK